MDRSGTERGTGPGSCRFAPGRSTTGQPPALSPATLKLMANGRLSTIVFPFKVSQLIRQGAKFLVIKETEKGRYRTPRDG